LQWQDQDVFFSELSEQLLSGESGFGTFQQNMTFPDLDMSYSDNGNFASGSVIR
jgi:hypothetical protein